MHFEELALTKICEDNDLDTAEQAGLTRRHFIELEDEFVFIQAHSNEHGKAPSLKRLQQEFPSFSPGHSEDGDTLSEMVADLKSRAKFNTLMKCLTSVAGAIDDDSLSTREKFRRTSDINKMLVSYLSDPGISEGKNTIINLADPKFLDDFVGDYEARHEARLNGGTIGVPYLWKSVNEITQGIQPGDLVAYCARTGVGKTFIGVAHAVDAWYNHDHPVLFISNEIDSLQLLYRVLAVLAGLPYNELRTAAWSKIDLMKKLASMMRSLKSRDIPFIIDSCDSSMSGDGVLATMSKVEKYREMAGRNSKELFLVIDGAYLMGDDKDAKNKYERAGNIVRDLKSAIKRHRVPTLVTWQMNRNSNKKEVTDETNIAYTDALNTDASTLILIYQTEESRLSQELNIQSLKARNHPHFSCIINCKFESMDFSEIERVDDDIDEVANNIHETSIGRFPTQTASI